MSETTPLVLGRSNAVCDSLGESNVHAVYAAARVSVEASAQSLQWLDMS